MRCIVSTCEQDYRSADVVMHRMPKKEPRRQQWIDAVLEGVRRGGGLPFDLDSVHEHLRIQDPRICSAHFLPEQYTVENGHRAMKKDAYPIIFPPDVAPQLPRLEKDKGKGAENRPKPNRAALMASKPAPKRPVSYGTRTCKAVQSGNPGLQPTARPVPPPGSPDYCRLCFTNQQLEPLCSGVIVVRDELLEKIYVCTGVLIIARPKESIYICVPCAALINNFSTFRQQICSNNRALLEALSNRNPPEIEYAEPPPPLVGTAVSSVLSQSHIVRGPAPKKIILTPPNKGVPLKIKTNTLPIRAPQQAGTPRLPTLTRAPNAPVIVKRIVYAKPGAVPIGLPPSSRATDEAAMELPEDEIKTEFDDPLDGAGDSGNALVMPKPLKPSASAISTPTTLKMRVESHPEPVVPAVIDGNESWKCCYCEQDLPFKFELAKHLLQVHKEGVTAIRERLDLDELNTNMLEMMALRAGSTMGRKVVVVQAPAVKRPRMDPEEVVEIE